MNSPSPCLRCTRVADPRNCENKSCTAWRSWFLSRWEQLRCAACAQIQGADLKPVGVNIGGSYYSPPHLLQKYLREDPCKKCLCPKELCTEPCRIRRAWDSAKGETFL